MSLVSKATQARNHNDLGPHPAPSPRGCRQQDVLPASEQLASRPGGPTTGYGYTGLVVTQASSVQPHRAPPGAAAAAAVAATGTTGPKLSHRAAAGAMAGSAHATITTTTAATSTGTAPAPAAAAVLETAAMCTIGGSGSTTFPSASTVRILLDTAVPHMALHDGIRVIPLPTTHHRPQRTYELRAASPPTGDHGRGAHGVLVLALAPPSMLRLLRSEQCIIKSEAVVVKWIRGVLLSGGDGSPPSSPSSSSSTQGPQRSDRRERSNHNYTDANACGRCGPKRQHCQAWTQDEPFRRDVDLLGLLPALVGHSQSGGPLGTAYNILAHPGGLALSSLPGGLTAPERRRVDFQAGRLTRRLSLLRSPSGKFGPATSVLCYSSSAAARHQGRAAGDYDGDGAAAAAAAAQEDEKEEEQKRLGGADRWSLAFHALLEGVLRDAEDMAVTLSYQAIRRHVGRLGGWLDAVTVARLVIVDATHDANMMAERRGGPMQDGDARDHPAGIRLTGLRGWGNCTFGDPLMATVFSEEPSADFLRGFSGRGQQPTGEEDDDDYGSGSGSNSDEDNDARDARDVLAMCGDIVERPEEARVRLLLYQCYHATAAVVREFYRPQDGSTGRELAARRRLHAVLARLEGVEDDDDPKRRHHARPPGEMSPAKKPKTEEEEREREGSRDNYEWESPGQ